MKISKTNKIKVYMIGIAIPLVLGAIFALLTMDAMEEYGKLIQPPLAPPEWLFPIVWTILYVLMGISSAIVFLQRKHNETTVALLIYLAQLVMNVTWTIIYFCFELRLAAFVWLIVLFALVITMIVEFKKVNRFAALLQIPYAVWLVFAGYLNLATYILNG